VTGGVWHPAGCRCSGCRPVAPRAPARNTGYQPARRPASARPVYRSAPRSHAGYCQCSRCVQVRAQNKGNYGIIGPGFLIICAVAVLGFWPAMVWHGEGGPSGTAWQWDVHSTIGCLVYWGVLIFVCVLARHGNRASRPASPQPPLVPPVPPSWPGAGWTPPPAAPPAAATGRPGCQHAGAVPVDLVTGERVAWLCPDCGTQLDAGFRSPVRGRAQ
jgi:hypothetical protein